MDLRYHRQIMWSFTKSSKSGSKNSGGSKGSKGKKEEGGPSQPAPPMSPDLSRYFTAPTRKKTPSPATSTTDVPKPPKKRSTKPRMSVRPSHTIHIAPSDWNARDAGTDQEDPEEEPEEEEDETIPVQQVVIAVSAGHTVSYHSEHHSQHVYASPAYAADVEEGPEESVPMQQDPMAAFPPMGNLGDVPIQDPIAALAHDIRDPYVAAMMQGQSNQPVSDRYSFPQLLRSNSQPPSSYQQPSAYQQNPSFQQPSGYQQPSSYRQPSSYQQPIMYQTPVQDPYATGMPFYPPPSSFYPPPPYQYSTSPPMQQSYMPYPPSAYPYAPYGPYQDLPRSSYSGPGPIFAPTPYADHSGPTSPVIDALREENKALAKRLEKQLKKEKWLAEEAKKVSSHLKHLTSFGRRRD